MNKIENVKYWRHRKIIKFMLDNQYSSMTEIAESTGVSRVDVANCIASAVKIYKFRFEFTSHRVKTGGYLRRYVIAEGESGAYPRDERIERSYTRDDLKNEIMRHFSVEHEQMLILLDAQNDYVTIRQLSDWAGMDESQIRRWINLLIQSAKNVHIHRIGNKLKLVAINRKVTQKNGRQTERDSKEKLLNSVFN